MSADTEKLKQERDNLKQEILADLARERLKTEIIQEITPVKRKRLFAENSVSRFLLGFLLTGIVGTWLTSYWQSRQWTQQQAYLATQQSTERRHRIIDEVTRGVSESYTAAEDILGLFTYWEDEIPAEERNDRVAYWRKASRDWRITSKQLLPKLSANFVDPEVKSIFDEVIKKRRRVGNNITNLLEELGKKKSIEKDEIKQTVDETTKLIDEATGADGQLRRLIKVMIEETKKNL